MTAKIAPSALEAVKNGPVRGMLPAVDTNKHGERVVHLIPWYDAARVPAPPECECADCQQFELVNGYRQKEHANPRTMRNVEIPEEEIQQRIIDTLPPEKHIPHRERAALLRRQLLADAFRSYQAHGYVQWPRSVEEDLVVLGWKMGNPNMRERFRDQVEDLIRLYLVRAANQQKENDQHKVVLDHAGHYSA